MIYYNEELFGDYLLPNLVAIKCDFCKQTMISSQDLEQFSQIDSDSGALDICASCLAKISPN